MLFENEDGKFRNILESERAGRTLCVVHHVLEFFKQRNNRLRHRIPVYVVCKRSERAAQITHLGDDIFRRLPCFSLYAELRKKGNRAEQRDKWFHDVCVTRFNFRVRNNRCFREILSKQLRHLGAEFSRLVRLAVVERTFEFCVQRSGIVCGFLPCTEHFMPLTFHFSSKVYGICNA